MKKLLVIAILLLILPLVTIAAEEAPDETPDTDVSMVINGNEKKCGAFWEDGGGEQVYVPDGWVEIETSINCETSQTIEACCQGLGYTFVEGNIGVTLEVLQSNGNTNTTTVVQTNTNDETDTSDYVVDETGEVVVVNSDEVSSSDENNNNNNIILYSAIVVILLIGFVVVIILLRRRSL